jgi:xanthine dehydrogenase iron-sulfur cluster and FAD-binding subunit A
MRLRLEELKERRRRLAAYSDSQRVIISEGVAGLKSPISADGLLGILKAHPSSILMAGGGVLLGTLLTKKLAKFSSGFWLGKKVFNLFRNGVFR